MAPPERDLGKAAMEKSHWEAADQFRANSGLKAQEYSGPILGLIVLRVADARFLPHWHKLKAAGGSERRGSREEDANAYQSEGLLYLPPGSRYQELLKRISEIPTDLEFDAFGRIYEDFLGEFARSEGQKSGEFFTPSCAAAP